MSEDELIMAVATLHGDINDHQKTVSKTEAIIANIDSKITRQEMLSRAARSSLESLVKQPAILMEQFKVLRAEMRTAGVALDQLRTERFKAVQVRNKALAAIPGLRKQLQRLEHQLDTYEPPRQVLEFRRDK